MDGGAEGVGGAWRGAAVAVTFGMGWWCGVGATKSVEIESVGVSRKAEGKVV